VFGEYFIKHMGYNSGEEDEEYDDESDNYITDDHARTRGSELSRRSKVKSATSRS
jgi:hypothetical protein